MQTTKRFLLPFTGGINSLALAYAVQLAEQYHATLVPLALIPQCDQQNVRLELIQQAQDFLEMTRRKASRRQVSLESSQLYTRNVLCSIEAFAREMHCEAVLLFLSKKEDILLSRPYIHALMEEATCNMHFVLLPEKKRGLKRVAMDALLGMPVVKQIAENDQDTRVSDLLQEQNAEHLSLLTHLVGPEKITS